MQERYNEWLHSKSDKCCIRIKVRIEARCLHNIISTQVIFSSFEGSIVYPLLPVLCHNPVQAVK